MENVIETFKSFDTDGNGLLSACEFNALVYSMLPDATPADARTIFAKLDTDQDGSISKSEIAAYFTFGVSPEGTEVQRPTTPETFSCVVHEGDPADEGDADVAAAFSTAKSAHHAMSRRCVTAMEEVQRLETELSDLQDKMHTAESSLLSARKMLASEEVSFREVERKLDREVEDLHAQLQQKEGLTDSLTRQLSAERAKEKELEHQLGRYDANIQAVTSALDRETHRRKVSETRLTEASKRCSDLCEQLKQFQARATTAEVQLSEERASGAELRETLGLEEALLRQSQKEAAALRERLSEADEAREDVRRDPSEYTYVLEVGGHAATEADAVASDGEGERRMAELRTQLRERDKLVAELRAALAAAEQRAAKAEQHASKAVAAPAEPPASAAASEAMAQAMAQAAKRARLRVVLHRVSGAGEGESHVYCRMVLGREHLKSPEAKHDKWDDAVSVFGLHGGLPSAWPPPDDAKLVVQLLEHRRHGIFRSESLIGLCEVPLQEIRGRGLVRMGCKVRTEDNKDRSAGGATTLTNAPIMLDLSVEIFAG